MFMVGSTPGDGVRPPVRDLPNRRPWFPGVSDPDRFRWRRDPVARSCPWRAR